MIRSPSITFLLLAALFLLVSADNCNDTNCKKCADPGICDTCNSNYILINSTCTPCNNVFSNCNVCNDTVLPLQCISCSKGFYSNSDFSACQTCSSLITNCAQCAYQAPFEKVQCSQCVDDLYVSDDKYSCEEPLSVTIIIVVAIVVTVLALGVGGFFLRRWLKKKKLENPLLQEEYQKAV